MDLLRRRFLSWKEAQSVTDIPDDSGRQNELTGPSPQRGLSLGKKRKLGWDLDLCTLLQHAGSNLTENGVRKKAPSLFNLESHSACRIFSVRSWKACAGTTLN